LWPKILSQTFFDVLPEVILFHSETKDKIDMSFHKTVTNIIKKPVHIIKLSGILYYYPYDEKN